MDHELGLTWYMKCEGTVGMDSKSFLKENKSITKRRINTVPYSKSFTWFYSIRHLLTRGGVLMSIECGLFFWDRDDLRRKEPRIKGNSILNNFTTLEFNPEASWLDASFYTWCTLLYTMLPSLHDESFSTWCIFFSLMHPSHQKLLGSEFPKQKHRDPWQGYQQSPSIWRQGTVILWRISHLFIDCMWYLLP